MRMRGRQALVPRAGDRRRAVIGGQTMPLRVSGKNIKIGEALRGRINARLMEAMAKYFDGGFSGHVTIGRDGYGFRTECVVHLDSGIVLEAEALAADAYASADQAALRIETRLRRYKRRRKDRQGTRDDGRALDPNAQQRDRFAAASPAVAIPASDDQESAQSNPAIIAESITALRRLSVSEAVMQLDVSGAPVLVFRHAGHGRVNLVYRRADGHIGWIDPPTVEKDAH
jgi:ribosomal subunit interface protein